MSGVDGRPRARVLAVVLAMYATFLLLAPFEHHDFLCHFKTPQHCTACSSSLVGADPNTPIPAADIDLADAGGTLTFHVVADDMLLTVRSTGRSPPLA
jgi:hypothetical protein